MTSTIPNTLLVLTDLIFTCNNRFNSCNSHRRGTEAQRNEITFRANGGDRKCEPGNDAQKSTLNHCGQS